jgi:methyl-accepting chemotaxis protein
VVKFSGSVIGNASWRTKLLILFCFFAAFVLIVGAAGAYAIYTLGRQTQSAVGSALPRVEAATKVRMAILQIDRDLKDLIAQTEPDAIRTAAVASIRDASALDEELQHLSAAVPDSAQVVTLLSMNETIKSSRMQIVQLARKNDDLAALTLYQSLAEQFKLVDQLSLELLEQQRTQLKARVAQLQEAGGRITTLLAIVIAVGMLLGALACWWGGNLLLRPLRHLRGEIGRLAKGELRLAVGETGRDEVGTILQTLSTTADNLRRILTGIQSGATRLNHSASSVSKIADEVSQAESQLAQAVQRIQGSSQHALEAAQQSGQGSAKQSRMHSARPRSPTPAPRK